jgi:hypothetical protein
MLLGMMAENLRDRMIAALRGFMESGTANIPFPVGLPLGQVVDLMIDVMSDGRGVPRLPSYDENLFGELRWSQPLDSATMWAGKGFPSLRVRLHPPSEGGAWAAGGVTVKSEGATDVEFAAVTLPPDDAEQFALTVLAVVAELRGGESAPVEYPRIGADPRLA